METYTDFTGRVQAKLLKHFKVLQWSFRFLKTKPQSINAVSMYKDRYFYLHWYQQFINQCWLLLGNWESACPRFVLACVLVNISALYTLSISESPFWLLRLILVWKHKLTYIWRLISLMGPAVNRASRERKKRQASSLRMEACRCCAREEGKKFD